MSEGGPLASFRFRSCVSAFCEMPTEIAREILPGDLQLVEVHHGTGILSAMAFEYQDTPFGDYLELVLGVAVAPRVEPGGAMPRSAFYPFSVASTSPHAREFASTHLHLPYYPAELAIEMAPGDSEMSVTVHDGGAPVLEMRVTEHEWREVDHAYQAIMRDGGGLWAADIRMRAGFSENEEQLGELLLHDHPLTALLPSGELEETPFREQWMRNGTQDFQQLRRVSSARA